MMWTAEHALFRETVRRFVAHEITPCVDAWEEAGRFPAHDLFKKMAALDLLGITYPPEYGGLGLDFWYTVVLCEELGQIACAGVPMGITVQTDMATEPLARLGSHALKERFLRPSIRGELVGCIGVTEPDAGSDVAAMRTRAVPEGENWVISGRKLYITNGTQADWICLLARTSEEGGHRGLSLIVVPTALPGLGVGRALHKLGNHSSDTAELVFDEVRVPRAYTIGPEGQGFTLQMQTFQRERLVTALLSYSACERIVRTTVAYTKGRRAFGRPLIANQVIQYRLAELLTEIEALRHLCYGCVEKLVAGEDYTREASMAKLKAGRLRREVADSCLQFYGGIGYMEEMPIARDYRDNRLLSVAGGADEVMLRIIAKLEGFVPDE